MTSSSRTSPKISIGGIEGDATCTVDRRPAAHASESPYTGLARVLLVHSSRRVVFTGGLPLEQFARVGAPRLQDRLATICVAAETIVKQSSTIRLQFFRLQLAPGIIPNYLGKRTIGVLLGLTIRS